MIFISIFAVILSKITTAQDIIIKDKVYPLIIIVPFLIVVIVWSIFFIVWTIRHRHKIALVLFNIGQLISKIFMKLGIFTNIKAKLEEIKQRRMAEASKEASLLTTKKVKQKVIKKEEEKKDLTPFLEKIETIENQLPKLKEKVVFKNFSEVVKSFFSTLFNLKYEFTEDELQQVLEKRRRSLVEFSKKLKDYKYSGKELTKNDLIKLIDEFKRIVEHYVNRGWKSSNISRKPVEKLVEEDKKILANIRSYIEFLKTESRKRQIEHMLEVERQIMNQNIKSIKRRYNKMLKLYVQLSPEERAVIYPQLINFYNSINKAIFSSIYSEKSKEQLAEFRKQLEILKNLPKKEPFLLKLKKNLSLLFTKKEKKPARKKVLKVPEPKPMIELHPVLFKLKQLFQPKQEPTRKVEVKLKPAPYKKMKLSTEEVKIMNELNKLIYNTPHIEKIDYVAKINLLLDKGWNALKNNNLDDAKRYYEQIKPYFVNLKIGERNSIYRDILGFYNAIEDKMEVDNVKPIIKQKKPQTKRPKKKPVSGLKRLQQEEKNIFEELERLKQEL